MSGPDLRDVPLAVLTLSVAGLCVGAAVVRLRSGDMLAVAVMSFLALTVALFGMYLAGTKLLQDHSKDE